MATKEPIKDTRTPKEKQTGQLAALLPVVGVPFMAVIFWALGGGAGTPASAAVATPVGINLALPEAGKADINASKLADDSRRDSTRNRELLVGTVVKADTAKDKMSFAVSADGATATPGTAAEQQVEAAKKQLALAQQLQQSAGTAPTTGAAPTASTGMVPGSGLTPQQQLMVAQEKQKRDMELLRTQQQIERINSQMNAAGAAASSASAASGGRPAVAVAAVIEPKKKPAAKTKAAVVNESDAVVSRFGNDAGQSSGASFQGFDATSGVETDANTLPAVIHEAQEVTNGSLVKMRLTDGAVVNGHKLAANTFIYGKCSLSGERLTIAIVSLKSGGNIFPANLEVYDVDGLQGLHIPGAISRDQAKMAGAQGVSGLDMMTMSSNPATMAAGVAVGAIKNVGSAKIRQVKVKLKAGYNIMLKVEKE
jgi:conjugative transposon TraM protein